MPPHPAVLLAHPVIFLAPSVSVAPVFICFFLFSFFDRSRSDQASFFFLLLLSLCVNDFFVVQCLSVKILQYNGGSVVAMTGKNCVAIASDLRLGQQQLTVGSNFDKCFKMHDHLYVALSGLASDIQSVSKNLNFKLNLYRMREEGIKPQSFCNMVCSFLYEKRFGPWFVEPLVAGLDHNNGFKPFIAGMDLIGCSCLYG